MTKLYKLVFTVMAICMVGVCHAHAAQVTFNPALIITGEYSDNWTQESDDDDKIDDFVTTAGLMLDLSVLGKTAGLSIDYNPSYNMFADNDRYDYWRHFAELSLWNAFGRNTRLELTSTFLDTEDPLDSSGDEDEVDTGDTPGIDPDPTRRGRDRYRINNNRLRLSHQFGTRDNFYAQIDYNMREELDVVPGQPFGDYDEIRPAMGIESWYEQIWGVGVDYFYSDRRYDDIPFRRPDREQHDGTLTVFKRFDRRLIGYLQYRHTLLNYTEQSPAANDYEVYSPVVGFEYVLRENVVINIGAGYYFQEYDNPALEEADAFYLDSEMNAEWALRTGFVRLTASSGYDIADTGADDLGLQIYGQARLALGHNFSSKLSGEVFAGYRYDDYPNLAQSRTDHLVTAGTGLSYQALRWLNFGLDYSYSEVTSDTATEEYDENRVVFTINMAPTRPYRLN